MAEPIRFFMDQHFPGPASQGLRRHGMDVLTAQEAERCSQPDPDQLAFALAEARVLVSFDPDFLASHQSGVPHAGIAWCPEQKYSIGQLVQALLLLHGVLDRASATGRTTSNCSPSWGRSRRRPHLLDALQRHYAWPLLWGWPRF